LALSINEALRIALNRPKTIAQSQFVHAVVLVKGTPFYGYTATTAYFLKVYLLDPGVVSKLVDLLQFGSVMGRRFQPHESHIPYLLQFLMDHNLYGMNFMRLQSVLFRMPLYGASWCRWFNIRSSQEWGDGSVHKRKRVCSATMARGFGAETNVVV
jgi:DNA polymerase zeta